MWLPRVRNTADKLGFQNMGEPPVMKFMKFPVAKWAIKSTLEVSNEMAAMIFEHGGTPKLVTDFSVIDGRFHNDDDLMRLWQGGE